MPLEYSVTGMKVWAVTYTDEYTPRTIAVFSTRADADRYANEMNYFDRKHGRYESYDVEEHDIVMLDD